MKRIMVCSLVMFCMAGLYGGTTYAKGSMELEQHHTYSKKAGELSYYKKCSVNQDITEQYPIYGAINMMNQTNRECNVYGLDLPKSYGDDVRYRVKMYPAGRGMFPATKDLWEYKDIPGFK